MKNSEWAALIEKNREEIEEKCREAFEKAMNDSQGSFHQEFAVVLMADGSTRIDTYTNASDEAEDVHYGKALAVTAYTYDPHWEDDWYASDREGTANESDEQRQEHLEDYIDWYESEYIQQAIDNLLNSLEE